MKKTIIIFLLFISKGVSQVQQVSSSEILLGLKKLNTVGSVLYIAAHPDDENTRLLSYLAKEKNVRAAYLSLTRGDGGQNLIGKEQGDGLGLIRTNELLAARRTDGAEQMFTRANDFGYSKNPEETFTIWNKDSILADVVWAIRKFKPDVIIYRFPTTGEGGHGHHTASGILAEEAFVAAADPKRFPNQLAYYDVWQAKRIFWNTFDFGGTNTTSENQLKLDVGVYNPLLGKSYGEVAAESRTNHKSQGFGSTRNRGSQIEYFKQVIKKDSLKTIFDGVDFSWNRFPGLGKIQKEIDGIIKNYSALQPELSLAALVNVYKTISAINSNDKTILHYKALKQNELKNLMLAASGLWLEAKASEYSVTPNGKITITAQVIKRNTANVKLNSIQFLNTDTTTNLILKQNEMFTAKHFDMVPAAAKTTNPYWLNEPHSVSMFTVNDQNMIGKPTSDRLLKYLFNLEIEDLPLIVEREIVYRSTDPVKGEVYRPFEVLPDVTINLSDNVFVFNETKAKKIQLTVRANRDKVNGTIDIKLPNGFNIEIKNTKFSLEKKNDEVILDATITPAANPSNGKLQASAIIEGVDESVLNKSIKRIEYDHIPYQFILSQSEAKIIYLDIQTRGNDIAYIPGAGDDVQACLKQIGYNVTELNDEMIAKSDLSKYTAIITGVRAYNTNDKLQLHHTKLMEYVNQGGNLIVQYNTNNRIGPVQAKIGPYPFTISRNRVTDEKADVRILKSEHPALNYPNKITAADFDNWIQERGIYHATDLDTNYKSILSMNDPNEKADNGSLIITKFGKGNFVYTGLAFFRELPAGVPGAYRLFTNLLSMPNQALYPMKESAVKEPVKKTNSIK
jgi:LmbE family N-acetylglucosaminyl deacetylase